MIILETARLSIRRLTVEDATFIFELLNEPAFLKNIGDRGADTLEGARTYIKTGPMASYAAFGFGLWAVTLKESGTPIGMCGLIRRETLDDVDIGYALLERYWGKGYAQEAAGAVLTYGYSVLKIPRIVAITAPDNVGSMRVLEKIGLRFERLITLKGEESRLFVPANEITG